ncbi:hypothetical protein L917_10063 [Phytophthora nicotianae]|uniref:Uncharacterized protein n=1 Tax=Phytophthora nicotianae TaxID=4792 RepID=W2L1U1_PHYNI|nr:hypothetical protein L917_10063 [Phytophthora nicotianae]
MEISIEALGAKLEILAEMLEQSIEVAFSTPKY